MITTFYPPYNFGGDGIFVHRLSNELASRGHHVEVIHCIDSYNLLAGRRAHEGYNDDPNVTVHSLKSRVGMLSPLLTQQTGFPFFKSRRIRRILERDFDVIHFHNVSLVGGPKILEYGRAIKLYTMHEYWLICPTHVLFKFNRSPCTKRACLSCSLAYKRPPQWWRYSGQLDKAIKQIDAFIAPSRFGQEIHRRMGLNAPIAQLPLFVPHPESNAVARPFTSDGRTSPRPYFLFVGRLEKLKGLHTLISLFPHYRKADLFVAGAGADETQLRQAAQSAPNIEFLGYVDCCRLQTLYRNAVAVIIPSLCYEVFPLVAIEAFSHHTPVIARNIGGVPEAVQESGGGITYSTDEELITAMNRMLGDPSYRNTLGTRGYKIFRQKWTIEAHLKSYFALINEVAKARGHSLDSFFPKTTTDTGADRR